MPYCNGSLFSPPALLKLITPCATNGNITFLTSIFNAQILSGIGPTTHSTHELFHFCCYDYSLLLLSYLSRIVIRILLVVCVDNIYRTSIIFLTVLPTSLHANFYLALVYTFYYQPLVQIKRYGPTVGTLQSPFAPAPSIPQERIQSTTTFHNPHF